MNFTDPSLYSATLPQREFGVVNPFLPIEAPFALQAMQRWVPPFGHLPMTAGIGAFNAFNWPLMQGAVPTGISPLFANLQKAALPYLPTTYGQPSSFGAVNPVGIHPYLQGAFYNVPFGAWQRPFGC